jgi:uncharacterized damage-inducible protein DinB
MVNDIQILINRELSSLIDELELFPDDKIIWEVLPGITNSAGNLALHLCGNLNHFIGAVLGNTGYIRDRESEFSRTSGSKRELFEQIRETEKMISSILPTLSEDVLNEDYPQKVGDIKLSCRRFLLHLAIHLSHHLGQIGYLRRILTQNNQSSGAVSLKAISKKY